MKRSSSDIPFAPSRCPFFYGWAILLCSATGILTSVPGQTIGVSPFTDYLMEALGLTRVQLSTAYLFGTLASAGILTFAGKLYDRFGARVVGTASAILLGVVLIGLHICDIPAQVAGQAWGDKAGLIVAFATILVGFFLLRFSGQGVLTMTARNMAMKWFDRRRGLANGIMGVMVAFGFSMSPRWLEDLIALWGWRNAWLIMGLCISVAFATLAAVFWRDNPEECGLLPDGDKKQDDGQETQSKSKKQFTLKMAMRTYSFWVFGVGLAMFSLVVTSVTFHIASIFELADMSREQAFDIFLPASFISVSLNLLGGYLADRIDLRVHLVVLMVGMAAYMIAVAFLQPGAMVWVVIVSHGVSGGMFGVLSSVTFPTFFGRQHLGALSGFLMTLLVAASAVGPLLFGFSESYTGSYAAAAMCVAAITLVLTVLSLFARNPQLSADNRDTEHGTSDT